jgi:hypothetical protein
MSIQHSPVLGGAAVMSKLFENSPSVRIADLDSVESPYSNKQGDSPDSTEQGDSTESPEQDKPVVPWSNTTTELHQNRVFIGDKAELVVDGHNMVHSMLGRTYDHKDFIEKIKQLSAMLHAAFPTQCLHVVFKNPPEFVERKYKADGIDFTEIIKQCSATYPIEYHIAKGKDGSSHIQKGRDDFLTVYLAKRNYAKTPSYIISGDKYRDFKDFMAVPAFTHIHIVDGKVKHTEELNPAELVSREELDKPYIGNQFRFSFVSEEFIKENRLVPGGIYAADGDETGDYTTIYLAGDKSPTII